MAAYPFHQAPKFDEFLSRLKEVGITVKTSQNQIAPGRGQILYLCKTVASKEQYYPLLFASRDERIQWSTIRMVCKAFDIDPAPFGLELDEKSEQAEKY